MSRFPRDFIDALLAKVDIVELIDGRVALKKSGSHWVACCPFHHEKSPSFVVTPNKQIYHCFGCGVHGNAIGFIMAYDRLNFIEAVEEIANFAGMSLPNPQESFHDRAAPQAPLYALLEQVVIYYQENLRRTPHAQLYLEKRGLNLNGWERFQVGYATPRWDGLKNHLGKSKAALEHLLTTGMLVKSQSGRLFDRFRDRIMIPIRNSKGQVVGFGGRALNNDTPKYLNSPETPIFHKSNELFGLYELKKTRGKIDSILVVEGYMDVIALHQHEITQSVATLGTATTSQHLQQLFRLSSDIIFCFDGDEAGRKAAWRALETCLPNLKDGLQIGFLFLPEHEDPDSWVRANGGAAFKQYLRQSQPLTDFFFEQLCAQVNLGSLDGKARLAKMARDAINKIQNPLFQQLMLEKLEQITGISPRILNHYRTEGGKDRAKKHQTSLKPSILSPLQLSLALILQFPDRLSEISMPENIQGVRLPGIPTLLKLLALLKNHPGLTTAQLLEHFRGQSIEDRLNQLACVQLLISPDDAATELKIYLNKIKEMVREQEIQQLFSSAIQGELTQKEKENLLQLIKKRHDLAEKK